MQTNQSVKTIFLGEGGIESTAFEPVTLALGDVVRIRMEYHQVFHKLYDVNSEQTIYWISAGMPQHPQAQAIEKKWAGTSNYAGV